MKRALIVVAIVALVTACEPERNWTPPVRVPRCSDYAPDESYSWVVHSWQQRGDTIVVRFVCPRPVAPWGEREQ